MKRLALMLLALAACAAPEPINGGNLPGIKMIYPDPATTDSLPLNAEGSLQTLLVFDVINFELVAPENNVDNVDGQGHVHAFLNDDYIPASALFLEIDSKELGQEFEAGDIITLRIDLRRNDHSALPDCNPCTQSIEVPAVEAESSEDDSSAEERFHDWLDEQDDPALDDLRFEEPVP